MSAAYTREILKVVVAKICQTIGWHNIQSTSLEIMVDILRRYITELTKLTHAYSTQFGHTQPNLDELGLAFRDMHINIADLEEFVRYVDFGVPVEVPQFPVKKESHLNFLKPGSDEVITRAVHIHEHLPPMLPYNEEAEQTSSVSVKAEDTQSPPNTDIGTAIFKRPADISPNDIPMKRPRLVVDQPVNFLKEREKVIYLPKKRIKKVKKKNVTERQQLLYNPYTLVSRSNTFANKPEKLLGKQKQIMDTQKTSVVKPKLRANNKKKVICLEKDLEDVEIEINFAGQPRINYQQDGDLDFMEYKVATAGLETNLNSANIGQHLKCTKVDGVSEIIIQGDFNVGSDNVTYIDVPYNIKPTILVKQTNEVDELVNIISINPVINPEVLVQTNIKRRRHKKSRKHKRSKKTAKEFLTFRPCYITRSITKRYDIDISNFY